MHLISLLYSRLIDSNELCLPYLLKIVVYFVKKLISSWHFATKFYTKYTLKMVAKVVAFWWHFGKSTQKMAVWWQNGGILEGKWWQL